MSDQKQMFFSAEIAEIGERLHFETAGDLLKWAEEERTRWKFIDEIDEARLLSTLRPSFKAARDGLRRVWSAATQAAEGDTTELKSRLHERLTQAYVLDRLPAPSKQFPEYLERLREASGDAVAASAFAATTYSKNAHFDLSHPDARHGAVAASMFQFGIDPRIPDAIAGRLANLVATQEEQVVDLSKRIEEFRQASAEELTRSATASAEQLDRQSIAHTETLSAVEAGKDKAISELEGVRQAFIEQMHLEAPVTYWTKKGKAHRQSEKTIRWWLVAYTILGGGALLVVLLGLAWLAADALSASQTAAAIKYAAVGALATLVALWVGRILLRFLISERHLAIDAEERITMVMTYLALTKDAGLEAADRALVLAPLFRSGSDGIVKDDGSGPDTALTAIVARLLDRLSAK